MLSVKKFQNTFLDATVKYIWPMGNFFAAIYYISLLQYFGTISFIAAHY